MPCSDWFHGIDLLNSAVRAVQGAFRWGRVEIASTHASSQFPGGEGRRRRRCTNPERCHEGE